MKLPVVTQTISGSDLTIPQDDFEEFFNPQENLEGVGVLIPVIRIAHMIQLFEMADGETAKSFEAVILDHHATNAWWEKTMKESGGKSAPDCFSLNGLEPVDYCEKRQSDQCGYWRGKDYFPVCPKNQFGSDRDGGKGKDCKNMHRLLLIMEESVMPRILSVPPSSLSSFRMFMNLILNKGINFRQSITKFSLTKQSSDGNDYAELKFDVERVINPDEYQPIINFVKQFRDQSRTQDVDAEEYVSPVEDEVGDTSFDYTEAEPELVKDAKEVFGENDIPFE